MFGDLKTAQIPVTHGASLAGYTELAHSVGLDAKAMVRRAGLGRHALDWTIPRPRSASRVPANCSRPALT